MNNVKLNSLKDITIQLKILYDKYDKVKLLLEQISEEIEVLETALMFKYNMIHRINELKTKNNWIDNLKK